MKISLGTKKLNKPRAVYMRQIYEEFLMEVVQDSIYIALLKSY